MLLRADHRTKDGRDHASRLLVEIVRKPDGPQLRTVCLLGERNTSAEAQWLVTIQIFITYGALHKRGSSRRGLIETRACPKNA